MIHPKRLHLFGIMLQSIFRKMAAPAEAHQGVLRPSSRAMGGIRFSVRKCDNARMLERFLFPATVKPL
jgi:hypothetical protein